MTLVVKWIANERVRERITLSFEVLLKYIEISNLIYFQGDSTTMNIQDTDKWGLTQLKISKCSYTWTIRNFGYLRKKVGEELESPTFSIGTHDETKWCLKLYIKGINDNYKDYLSIYLYRKSGSEYKVDGRYAISILNAKREKFAEENEECEYNKNYSSWGFPAFIKGEVIEDAANNLLTNDTLTLLCELSIVLGIVNLSSEVEKVPDKISERATESNEFEKLLLSERFSDVKLLTHCGREIPAHKNILAAKSPAFAAMFEHEMMEKKRNVVEIPDVDHDVLREMLRFVYSGRVECVESLAGELIVAADKYRIEGLKTICERVLADNITVENVVQILVVADRHSVGHLKSRAINFIKAHIRDVIGTDGFKSLVQTSVLADIIQAII